MALSEEEKEERRSVLDSAKVPRRFFNLPLSKRGVEGEFLREYTKNEYRTDALAYTGGIIVSETPSLAPSFARDIAIIGASCRFYYLRTFVNNNEEVLPQAFVIDWFEQKGVESPFSPKERYSVETTISTMLDEEFRFYLFTSVHPDQSTWWSRQFIQRLKEQSRILEVPTNADQQRNTRTPVGNRKVGGRKVTQSSSRTSIR